MATEWEAVLA
jgi:hypothetical protein